MREKLLDLMKNEGLKSSQLAEMLGINPAGISHILAGRNKPGFDLLQKILRRFPRINPDWLLLDAPNMYRDQAAPTMAVPAAPTTDAKSEAPADLFSIPGQHLAGRSERAAAETGSSHEMATPVQGSAMPGRKRAIARIVIFYEDQTFESYTPEKTIQ